MSWLTSFLFIYVLGGVTFIPIVLAFVLLHAYLTFPVRGDSSPTPDHEDGLLRPGDSAESIRASSKSHGDKAQHRGSQDSDVAAGYFAVCREYVPRGLNGKPPERTTPIGSTAITSPSPSVYQSMYRSIFDRKQPAGPLDSKGVVKPHQKGTNVFFVVLRHAHLMLFDDEDQLEVRYVISLNHHEVSIYGGGEHIPDGELFIKRNAIYLSRRTDAGETMADGTVSKPFFLFTDHCSEKEDFYFALLKNQERIADSKHNPPVALQFEIKDIIDLVQRLHSSEENMQTRWINALLGRVFLGIYKTKDVENFIRAKITKKISRVKKPTFLSRVVLRSVDMGEGAPYITNPRLKDLTVDGDCVLEADLLYTGNSRVEIAATVRIDLGTRFKAREVDLVLAVVLKKIEGHMLFRIKPPPSNRIWFTFESMPKIEMTVEPVVSARQITYTLILRQIENRIKEVVAESVVFPFWDDVAFFSTEGKRWRGGVWVDDTVVHTPADLPTAVAEGGDVDAVDHIENDEQIVIPPLEKSLTMPLPEPSTPPSAFARKANKSVFSLNLGGSKGNASSSSVDVSLPASDKPRVLRHGSFNSVSSPIVETEFTTVDAFKPASPPKANHAASAMAAISARSNPPSGTQTPVGSPSRPSSVLDNAERPSSYSSHDSKHLEIEVHEEPTPQPTTRTNSDGLSTHSSEILPDSPRSNTSRLSESIKSFGQEFKRQNSAASSVQSSETSDIPGNPPKRVTLISVANAAANARRWGLNALQRNIDLRKEGSLNASNEPDVSQPMGRGRPLPPPGVPLPRPEKKTKTAPIPVPKKKLVASPPDLHQLESGETQRRPLQQYSAPALPKRRIDTTLTTQDETIFVVAAPDSEPTTPLEESKTNYLPPWVDEDGEEREIPAKAASPPSPPLPRRRPTSKLVSTSPDEDANRLPSWMAAQEEEARAKTLLVDEDSGTLPQ